MKILIIGSGGREHALSLSFHRNGHQTYCLPGNTGTDLISTPLPKKWETLQVNQHQKVADFVKAEGIDLTVVGPEAPLAEGIVDLFTQQNLTIFGPKKHATLLESSKVWAKEFMTKYEIPTAPFYVCDDPMEALELIPDCFEQWSGIVVKPDGLTAGKGVIPCDCIDTAKEAIQFIMEEKKYGVAGSRVILEKKLVGPEVSILAFCDGKSIVPMIPSQDHKRLLDGDKGPNTGGVGAYSPLPFLTKNDIEAIHRSVIDKTLEGLKSENIDYKGVIYFGLMLTEEGPQLLEYNCRFGDPETQAILPLLKSDLGEIMLACCKGELSKANIHWSTKSACCVVMTSGGYPETFQTGHEITGLEELRIREDIICFHAGTRWSENKKIVTNGGRVLSITALGDNLESAVEKVYSAVETVHFQNAYYRKDIAHQALIKL